jgi:uncharacterized membrane protein
MIAAFLLIIIFGIAAMLYIGLFITGAKWIYKITRYIIAGIYHLICDSIEIYKRNRK